MMNQTMLEHLTAYPETSQTAGERTGSAGGKDFDEMVSRKRREAGESSASESAGSSERKKAGAPEKTAEDAASGEDAGPTAEQYGVAAAMLLQSQPDQRTVELLRTGDAAVVETAQVQTAPDSVTEASPAQIRTPARTAEPPVQTRVQDAGTAAPAEAPAAEETAEPRLAVQVPGEASRTPETRPEASEAAREVPAAEKTTAEASVEAAPEQSERAGSDLPETEDAPAEDAVPAENVQVERLGEPLFQDVEAAPVKVAEPGEPIPLESGEGVEKLAEALTGELNAGDVKVELTLVPESLGRITVEIVHSEDGAIRVALSASDRGAEKLLTQRSGELQSALAGSGRDNVRVEVRESAEDRQQPDLLNSDDAREQEQQRQQQRQRQSPRHETDDFIQQLRLGLRPVAAE